MDQSHPSAARVLFSLILEKRHTLYIYIYISTTLPVEGTEVHPLWIRVIDQQPLRLPH